MKKAALVLLALVMAFLVNATGEATPKQKIKKKIAPPGEFIPRKAIAVLHGLGDSQVKGIVTFTEKGRVMEVSGEITGLTPGEHAFHVHEYGDCSSADGMSAGGHFNPDKKPHGGPQDAERHVGDLGNLTADENGKAIVKIEDKELGFFGPHSIIGRSLIVHAKADDLKSQPAGNAGGRVACAVIGIAKP
jgi:Cu-Zn family superoxide dismutase